ncbi:hypothetical protein AgCh_009618 [Apium graveolens]
MGINSGSRGTTGDGRMVNIIELSLTSSSSLSSESIVLTCTHENRSKDVKNAEGAPVLQDIPRMFGIIFRDRQYRKIPTNLNVFVYFVFKVVEINPLFFSGTLDRHLKTQHGISKQSHESGEADGESPQQTQIGGFVQSSPGGVVPASTIASESAFSAGRRVLDEKRSSLAPDVVKICVRKKDWDQAAKRQQGRKNDDSDDEEDT